MRSRLAAGLGTLMIAAALGGAHGDAEPERPLTAPAPLAQTGALPDRVAAARVADPDGRVIGAVQRVELLDGKPVRLEVALLGSETVVTLDAATLRYDAASNVVTASQGASQLLARPKD